jgi:hypothetical protein
LPQPSRRSSLAQPREPHASALAARLRSAAKCPAA